MKITSKLLSQFNSPDTLLVISPYPAQGTTHNGGGIASYTKNTLLSINKADRNHKIVILTNIIDEPETYLENGFLVVRCFDRKISLFAALISHLSHFNHVKNVLFEFEFAAYGDLYLTALVPCLLGFLHLSGKSVTTVLHQVVTNLDSLSNHTGLVKKPRILRLFNQSLRLFYRAIVMLSNHVVTLEIPLAARLVEITSATNIVAIPHGLYPRKANPRTAALTHLNLNSKNLYVLAFGYLSHYKGSDLIASVFSKPIKVKGKTVKLILAGGESPTQGQKGHYRGFYKRLYDVIDNNEDIIHTGFVPETRLANYFSGADLVVFPYRTFMSASGPLSLAAAYRKPFLVSQALSAYNPVSVKPTVAAFRQAIANTLSSRTKLAKLGATARNLARERDFAKQGQVYLDLINRPVDVKLDLWSKKSPNYDIGLGS